MNDKRDLRLTSRKYFKPKHSTKDAVPLDPVSLNPTLPSSAYTNGRLVSLDILHNRLKKYEAIQSGNLTLYYLLLYSYVM